MPRVALGGEGLGNTRIAPHWQPRRGTEYQGDWGSWARCRAGGGGWGALQGERVVAGGHCVDDDCKYQTVSH